MHSNSPQSLVVHPGDHNKGNQKKESDKLQKLPLSQPQISPISHISKHVGQGGSSSTYDSYSDNRP